MNDKNITMKEIINEKDKTKRNEKYESYVDQVTPKHSLLVNMIWAFVVGGSICLLGQIFTNTIQSMGLSQENASTYSVILLILLSCLLTATGLYAKIAKFGGAGAVVPITGFANSVSACAIEFKKEGNVFGIGCRIFYIAGPVILYGIFTSWVLGLIYYLVK